MKYFRAKRLCDYNTIVLLAAGGVESGTTLSQHRDAVDETKHPTCFCVGSSFSVDPLSVIYFVPEVVGMGCAFKAL